MHQETPLHVAIQIKAIPIIKLLCLYGADPSIKKIIGDKKKKTISLCGEDKDLIKALSTRTFEPFMFPLLPPQLKFQIRFFLLCHVRYAWKLPDEVRLHIVNEIIIGTFSDWKEERRIKKSNKPQKKPKRDCLYDSL